MFICNDCLTKKFTNGESMFKSRGACEICDTEAVCNEIASKNLHLKEVAPKEVVVEDPDKHKASLICKNCLDNKYHNVPSLVHFDARCTDCGEYDERCSYILNTNLDRKDVLTGELRYNKYGLMLTDRFGRPIRK